MPPPPSPALISDLRYCSRERIERKEREKKLHSWRGLGIIHHEVDSLAQSQRLFLARVRDEIDDSKLEKYSAAPESKEVADGASFQHALG